jgi:hypothetical protein
MKSNPAEKKQTLKLKVNESVNYRLIGISSHENDYRLVWAVNNELKMQFVKTENLTVHNLKLKTSLEFSRYTCHDEERYLKYYLISNRCPDGFLFPDIKNIDFLVQIFGEMSDNDIQDLVKRVKKVTIVSAVFLLQPSTIKGITKILTD